ncbi:hypothetical protein DB41_IF00010 [Neochlamydia sp. TUME1]|nr:hypothetical protein DB41_IF00010 [Neochlamydia sp. TUME1]
MNSSNSFQSDRQMLKVAEKSGISCLSRKLELINQCPRAR